MVENQSIRKLKCLWTDNGGEFKSEEFVKICRERGIRREYTAPYKGKAIRIKLSEPREKIEWQKKYIKRSQEERNEMIREGMNVLR